MKKAWIRILVVAVIAASVLIGLIAYSRHLTDKKIAELGENAVKLLYDYGTVEQLDFQMSGLKEITTEEVFNQLTIDNEERTLNTYLKFKQDAVTVNVIRSTDKYVMYHLQTNNVSANRIFVFFFTVNDKGLIDWVQEVEAVDFITNYS